MKIEVASESSFCPGVDRAMRITEKTLRRRPSKVYSMGALIHNPQVVEKLRQQGLQVLEPGAETGDLDGAVVVVRSHGIDMETERSLERLGARLVDATCPTVKRAQEAARDLAETGCDVVVIGSPSHPEVRSIVGRAGAPVAVVSTPEEAREWALSLRPHRVGLLSQTTINRDLLESVRKELETHCEVVERDTICESVGRRQREAFELAGLVDVMFVVGGRESSNTAQLAAISERAGVPTHHIESPREIEPGWLEGVETVGVIGGASTPRWLIDDTVAKLEELSS